MMVCAGHRLQDSLAVCALFCLLEASEPLFIRRNETVCVVHAFPPAQPEAGTQGHPLCSALACGRVLQRL